MKRFLKAILSLTFVLALYHLAMGLIVYDAVKHIKGEELTWEERANLVVKWPVVLVASQHVAVEYKELMEGIEDILVEINSGRWERKPE